MASVFSPCAVAARLRWSGPQCGKWRLPRAAKPGENFFARYLGTGW